ncbi:MAG: serine racemase VanT catalytic subunit [Clostridium sp.]|nr:serine racemase VanT catalytic subunit [Clostridium sp.]
MEDNKNLGGLDLFKVIAAFLVVAIHTAPLSIVNDKIDFLFTGILARIAVPFFLMTTGFFLLPQYLFKKLRDYCPFWQFIKKTFLLYIIAIIIYLPVNLYAKQLREISFFDFLRMLIFDGTFYHLWYLPAAILGTILLVFASRKLSYEIIFAVTLVLYCFGLLGDSYYGFISNGSILHTIYQSMFQVFSYTRNGIFYTPVFLVMGAGIKYKYKLHYPAGITCGFIISVLLMIFEGLTLNHLGVQRHDSMYIALLPVSFFLFQAILQVKAKPGKSLRTISTWIYILHPLFIILIRGAAKMTHTEAWLIENSLIHYLAVCLLSIIFAAFLQKILLYIKPHIKHNLFPRELWLVVHKTNITKDRAWIELDMKNLRENVHALESLLPQDCKLMPVVKADAYGHGAVSISKELNRLGVNSFCVAAISEGITLRQNGIKGDILILGYTHPDCFPLLRKYRLTQSVIDFSYARLLNSYGRKIKVHIKIDTGMRRLGERAERIKEICQIFHCENLIIEGIYTHLCADETKTEPNRAFTLKQAHSFFDVISELKAHGYICKKIHLLASYGLINYPEYAGNYARVGIALYGVLSSRTDIKNCPISLYPVLSVKARIALTKDLYAGETAGYGLQYTAKSDKKIAVLSIGYADGIPRSLSCENGKVLINGANAPVIGQICMDQMLVDITDIPNVKSGDIAVIIGKSGQKEITAYDLAEKSGTITNEILSRLGARLSRIPL